MGAVECVILGVAVGADSFTVAVGLGLSARMGWRRVLRIAALFGVAAMALSALGYALAALLRVVLLLNEHFDWFSMGALQTHELAFHLHWVFTLLGAALLAGLGVNFLFEYAGRSTGSSRTYRGRFALALLALSVSADAALAGLGLGMLDGLSLGVVVGTIGACSGLLTCAGLGAGRRLGRVAGRQAQLVSGVMLIGLACHFAIGVLA